MKSSRITRVLVLNSLDAQYGSTYRIRAIRDLIQKCNVEVVYIEQPGNAFQKLLRAVFEVSVSKFDVLFTQKFNPITILAILIAKLRRKPIIVDWDDFDSGLQKGFLKKILASYCETIGPYLAHQITTHSKEIEQKAKTIRPTILIQQGFDAHCFLSNPTTKEACRQRWNFSMQDKVIGYLCTLTHGGAMDIDPVLCAWKKLTLPNVRFFLIGGGPLEKKIQLLIHDHGLTEKLVMSGLIDHQNVPLALQCLDVGCIYMSNILANHARVSFKVIEYLAMNIPVVGQVIGETKRLFGSYIHNIHNTDCVSFAHAIENVLKADEIPNTAPLVKSYSWENTSPMICAMMQSFINKQTS